MLHSKLDHIQYMWTEKVGEAHICTSQFFYMLFLGPLQMNSKKRPLSRNDSNSSYGQQLVAQ